MQDAEGRGRPFAPTRIEALNTSRDSRGSIHDDEKAREMGYRGGLVPGVTVLAYMTRVLREQFGPDWATGGSFSGVLRRPVYEGDIVTVEGDATPPQADGRQTVTLRVLDPEGRRCATGEAVLRAGGGAS